MSRRFQIEEIPKSWLQRSKVSIIFWSGITILAFLLSLMTYNLYIETRHSRDVENALCLPGMLEHRHGKKLLCTSGDHRWIKDIEDEQR